ncbi:MAG: NAD(P)/FAD-dependent oxidoreductase [Chitinophagaceae bacterium]
MQLVKLYRNICIVGAGPAGAALSIFLGKENIPHIILDAATFPRDKTCGDGLDLKAIAMLNHIDESILEKEIQINGNINASWGFRLINPKGKYTEFVYQPVDEMKSKPPYATAKRYALDNILVNRFDSKYSTFLQAAKVVSVDKIEGEYKWKVIAKKEQQTIEILCNLIVGADGDHSIVLKNIGERKVDRNHYAAGVRQYWQGIEGIHNKGLMEVYYPKKYPMSYFWIFPLGSDSANVGYGMLSAIASKNNFNIKEIFIELIREDEVLKERFKNATTTDKINGWGLPFASLRRKCFGDGWLLVGDAASMISPTTGEGIGTGMQSGYIASKFISKAVKENKFDESVFKNYDREIYKRMNDDIRLFNISNFISPKMMGWFMNYIVPLPYFKKLFQQKVSNWIDTAYNKTITVSVD